MREIMIKTSTAPNHKRKNLAIVEMINQNGFVARAEKKYSYYVSEQNNQFADAEQMQKWVNNQSKGLAKKNRHVAIKKIFDKKSGVGQMIYRVIGSFYVVQNMHVFAVVFMHTIKFDMLSGGFSEPKTA